MKNRYKELAAIALIILSAILLYFVGLNSFGITDPGESYYAEAGREMIESGDYITPHLNYQIYFSKPILTFWIVALAYKLFGVNEFAARVLFACLVLVLIMGTYWLARRIRNSRCGLMAGLILATAPLLMAEAKLSPVDVGFACFLNLAIYALILTALYQSAWWPVFYISLALAVLTKGPAALLFVALGTAVFIACERAPIKVYLERLRRLHLFAGGFLFLAIALPWYVAVSNATGGLWPKVFFLYENLARIAGHTNLAHASWYRYFLVLLYGFCPWVLFLVPGVGLAIKRYVFTGRGSDIDSVGKNSEQPHASQAALLFLFCWGATVFVFFSISKTQLDTYLLPVIAPFAILIANYLETKLQGTEEYGASGDKSFAWIAYLFLLLGIAVPIAGSILWNNGTLPAGDFRYGAVLTVILLASGYVAQVLFYKRKRYGAMLVSIFAATVLALAVAGQIAFGLLDDSDQKDLKNLSLHWCDSNTPLAVFKTFKPSIMFHTRRPVDSFFHTSQIVPSNNIEHQQKDISYVEPRIFVHDKCLPELMATPGIKFRGVESVGRWSVWEPVDAQLEKVQTLEAMFSNQEAFNRAVKGQNDWGPLTVPYAAGNPKWKR